MLRWGRFRLDKQVELLCPRGHFIATLRAYDTGDGLRITPMYPPRRGTFEDIHQQDLKTGNTVHTVRLDG